LPRCTPKSTAERRQGLNSANGLSNFSGRDHPR
jgi:hypothetical protein